MTKKHPENKETKEVNYPCNMCGMTCVLKNSYNDQPYGMINAVVSGGYESTPGNGTGALDDMTYYHFNLCEFCIDDMFTRFTIPPRLDDGDHIIPKTFIPAKFRVEMDDWRRMKEEFTREYELRRKAREHK